MWEIQFKLLDRTKHAEKAHKLPVVIHHHLSFCLDQRKGVADCPSQCVSVQREGFIVSHLHQGVTGWTGKDVLGEH